jgi:hypothetical protein
MSSFHKSEEERSFNDPKIQLILSIKQHDEKITFYLENGAYLEAGKSLHYLLHRLEITDAPEDRNMQIIRDNLTLDSINRLSAEQFDYAYIELHKFLNRTYYKGFSNNRPPTRESSIQGIGAALKK